VSGVQRLDICARSRILGPLAAAAVSFVVLELHGDEAPAQSVGCGRCGTPTVSPTMALPVPLRATFERPERRWALGTSLRVPARRETRGAYMVCVRTCDGSFFPVSYSGGRTDWSGPLGADRDQAADLTVCRAWWSSNCLGLR
jgi:hypothetical protein